jgi:phenylpropionate dioxygenase-like ring-hydroxylating dioxygenase large terminal subunit
MKIDDFESRETQEVSTNTREWRLFYVCVKLWRGHIFIWTGTSPTKQEDKNIEAAEMKFPRAVVCYVGNAYMRNEAITRNKLTWLHG